MRKYFLFILFGIAALLGVLLLASPVLSSWLYKDADTEDIPDTVYANFADPTVPKYGGIHNRLRIANWYTWDYAAPAPSDMTIISMMGEELLGGDWAKGPAGTNKNDWTSGFGGFTETLTGRLAEDWEMPDNETIVYHIRQGVHWWNREPANGRELTADDVAWNIERHFSSPKSFDYKLYTKTGMAPLEVQAPDRYTVEVKVNPMWQGVMAAAIGDHLWMLCPDAVEANGGEPLKDWQQFIGTGPFMIDNYGVNSFIEYVRNPDYWQTDPLHPENRLPYADGVKELIIFNMEQQKAAFRTGQVDTASTVSMTLSDWDEADFLKSKHPQLEVKSYPGAAVFMIWPRLDDESLPFRDIRIRQAMNLAVNQQELVDDYYGGSAELLTWPYPDLPVFDGIYTPLEEQSQIVRDLFGYDVERAREMVIEAGYPNGFNFTLYAQSQHTDFLSIIKEYLREINIDMELAYLTEWLGSTYQEVVYGMDFLLKPQEMTSMIEGSPYNYSRVRDSRIQEAYSNIARYRGINDVEVARILKELGPYQLELAVPIYLPSPHSFVVWWPWLQNYYGAVGGGGYDNIDEYIMYFWIDNDMKTEMGY
ncbi:ABC transporter substrate-binding protein [Chloroflexota bacterium]